jgi:hypothetical protein
MSTKPEWPKVGMIVSFLANPSSVALGVPVCDPKQKVACFYGTVVGVKAMEPHGIGKVPTACVSIRGQSGRTVVVDGAGVYLNEHPSFEAAKARPVPLFQ